MKVYLYIIVLFLFVWSVTAQEKSLFDRATDAYAEGDYKAAIEDYKAILDEGKVSPEVYYNLANSYYKSEQLAPSIFYYNKALQLAPQDREIRNNLLLAEEQTLDLIEETRKTGFKNFINNLISTYNFNTWAVIGIVFSFLFMIFGAFYYFHSKVSLKRLFFTLSVVGLLGGILSVVFAYKQFEIQQNKRFAIVFAEESEVHAEPNFNSGTSFILHEGTKVKVLDNFNGYSKIEIADGQSGWIDEEAIKGLWLD